MCSDTFEILTEDHIRQAKNKFWGDIYKAAEKFEPVFRKMGYKWSIGDQYRVPNSTDIEVTISCLIHDLSAGDYQTCVSTGRIELRVFKYKNAREIEARIRLIAETIV